MIRIKFVVSQPFFVYFLPSFLHLLRLFYLVYNFILVCILLIFVIMTQLISSQTYLLQTRLQLYLPIFRTFYQQFLRYYSSCMWSVKSESSFYTIFKCVYLKNMEFSSNGFQITFAEFFVLGQMVWLGLIFFLLSFLAHRKICVSKTSSRPPKICHPHFLASCSHRKTKSIIKLLLESLRTRGSFLLQNYLHQITIM